MIDIIPIQATHIDDGIGHVESGDSFTVAPLQDSFSKATDKSILDEIYQIGVIKTNDERKHYETIFDILAKSNDVDIRNYALDIFTKLISQRNNSISIPTRLWKLLHEEERELLLKFRAHQKKLSERTMITKYPNLYFESEDICDFSRQYFAKKTPPFINKNTNIVTIGSCFAINIANHLDALGYNAKSTELAELANNSYTNLSIVHSIENEAYFEAMVKAIPDHRKLLEDFRDNARSADVFIFTVGLSYAFFAKENGQALNMPLISYCAGSYRNFEMRPIDVNKNVKNIIEIISIISRIRPDAKIVTTLSPVPMDGGLNLHTSIVEADCISKSIGRVSLAIVEERLRESNRNFFYFPAFEIVRWVGCNQNIPLFGGSDHLSRHVTDTVIKSVMETFTDFYCEKGAVG